MIVFFIFSGLLLTPLFYSFLKKANLVLALILSNLLIFVLEIFTARFMPDWYEALLSLAFPQWNISLTWLYQVFTHAFLHAGIAHILGNILVLFFAGMAFEERAGFKLTAIVYFSSMVFAVLFDTMFNFGRASFAIGASGAVSGILGAMLMRYPKVEIPMVLGPIFLMRVKAWIAILFFFAIEVLMSFFSLTGFRDNTAHLAHVGGFITGIVVAVVLPRAGKSEAREQGKALDFEKLSRLVENEEQRRALEHLKGNLIEEVAEVWLNHFALHSRCKKCGKALNYKKPEFYCTCGEAIRVWK